MTLDKTDKIDSIHLVPIDVRCGACNRLLFKVKGQVAFGAFSVEIVCPRCSALCSWPNLLSVTVADKTLLDGKRKLE